VGSDGTRWLRRRNRAILPRMKKHKEIVRTAAYEIHILGAPTPGLRDLYHALLRVPWWAAFVIIVASYLILNVFFATLYYWTGGVANARADHFTDAFFFSVQTMGTIGYGAMSPTSAVANWLVVCESVTGLVLTALITGLVFVRFSQTRARLIFSSKAAIGKMDGVPTLMVRIGNERRGSIVGTEFRLNFARTTKTAEGVTMYRFEDLPLVRSRAAALSRSWSVLHKIVEGSPLHGFDAEKFGAVEGELQLEVVGIDDTSLQPVHAQYTWYAGAVAWDSRLADVLSETPDGNVVLDLRQFHEVVSGEG
jgi:inward rectifier potassium channel